MIVMSKPQIQEVVNEQKQTEDACQGREQVKEVQAEVR